VPGDGVRLARSSGTKSRSETEGRLSSEGLVPRAWANGAGYRYTSHSHPYEKVLYCVSGSIVFHTAGGDVSLEPGDLLEIDPGVEHSATVGERGVECVEAARPPRQG
jgi:mannose-6-phosphate isomerase-like protein (cupin superfamily)